MESSTVVGFMGVFAVSAGVVLLARQAHAYLLSDFMKKLELELGGGVKARPKKRKTRTRFSDDDVTELSLNNKEYQEQHLRSIFARENQTKVTTNDKASTKKNPNLKSEYYVNMPLNRVALYKGIMEYKAMATLLKDLENEL